PGMRRGFQAAMQQAGVEDLEWFFDQWVPTTATLDYIARDASTERRTDGRWVTRVDVERVGDAWMPVVLQVGDERVRLDSRERRQRVEVVTAARPAEVVLDPDVVVLDVDRSNNRRALDCARCGVPPHRRGSGPRAESSSRP